MRQTPQIISIACAQGCLKVRATGLKVLSQNLGQLRQQFMVVIQRGKRFLLTVTATDRTGLLYEIARIMARNGLDVSGARVTTLGERAEDTFTIEGQRLGEEKRRVALERELLEALATR